MRKSSSSGQPSRRVELGGDIGVAVLVDQLAQQRAIELGRVHVRHALGAAPLPMLDQVTEQLAAPADAALEEREAQIGKRRVTPPRNSALATLWPAAAK